MHAATTGAVKNGDNVMLLAIETSKWLYAGTVVRVGEWRAELTGTEARLLDAAAESVRAGGTLVYSLHHPCWVPGNFETWAAQGSV